MILHPTTKRLVGALIQNPPHSLLITGARGVGASTLAAHIAKQLSPNVLTVMPEKDEVVDLEKGIISVTLIRRLYEQTRTTISSRVIIIDYAERMAPAAQNTFLKLLEEPTKGTMFILVSHEPSKLLPTVRSRVQRLEMQSITQEQTMELLNKLDITDPTKRTQLLYMAAGLPAEITRLVSDEKYFTQNAQLVRDARDLLKASPYDRLRVAHKYKEDRAKALKLCEIAMSMLKQSTAAAPQAATTKKLEQLLDTYDRISANGNIRLQLTAGVL